MGERTSPPEIIRIFGGPVFSNKELDPVFTDRQNSVHEGSKGIIMLTVTDPARDYLLTKGGAVFLFSTGKAGLC
jgi:hypothetical protein